MATKNKVQAKAKAVVAPVKPAASSKKDSGSKKDDLTANLSKEAATNLYGNAHLEGTEVYPNSSGLKLTVIKGKNGAITQRLS